jgi:hypothetical protein
MSKEHRAPIFFVAALLFSGLSTARTEENCLLAPNARAPQGSHWHYRIGASSQNKCWYLRAEGQKDEQPVQQQKPEQAGVSAAAAPPPLPRPAPDGLRRSNSAPTDQTGSGASVGIVEPGEPQAKPRGVPSGASATWPPPAASATNTDVWSGAPTGTAVAPAPSSPSSDNAMARHGAQPLAADENNATAEIPQEVKPNTGLIQQQSASDNVRPEKDITAHNKASYEDSSLAIIFIIVASLIVVGIMLIRTLVRMREAIIG